MTGLVGVVAATCLVLTCCTGGRRSEPESSEATAAVAFADYPCSRPGSTDVAVEGDPPDEVDYAGRRWSIDEKALLPARGFTSRQAVTAAMVGAQMDAIRVHSSVFFNESDNPIEVHAIEPACVVGLHVEEADLFRPGELPAAGGTFALSRDELSVDEGGGVPLSMDDPVVVPPAVYVDDLRAGFDIPGDVLESQGWDIAVSMGLAEGSDVGSVGPWLVFYSTGGQRSFMRLQTHACMVREEADQHVSTIC